MTALQLPLRFPSPPAFAASDLLPNAAQDEARAWLARPATWPLHRLALHGEPGSGKTHLAHIWAETHGARIVASPPARWPDRPLVLDGLDTLADEIGLLHLLNAATEARQPLLLVSRTAAGRLPVRLPDLASRLRATVAVGIGPADGPFLELLLARLLSDRQLRIPAPVQAWLLARLPRSPGAIRDAVTRLDTAALAEGRNITRPMAAATLGLAALHDTSAQPASDPSPPPQGIG